MSRYIAITVLWIAGYSTCTAATLCALVYYMKSTQKYKKLNLRTCSYRNLVVFPMRLICTRMLKKNAFLKTF